MCIVWRVEGCSSLGCICIYFIETLGILIEDAE